MAKEQYVRIQVSGFAGICCICGCPILLKESTTIIPEEETEVKRHFHKSCLQENPNAYYVKKKRNAGQKYWQKEAACTVSQEGGQEWREYQLECSQIVKAMILRWK